MNFQYLNKKKPDLQIHNNYGWYPESDTPVVWFFLTAFLEDWYVTENKSIKFIHFLAFILFFKSSGDREYPKQKLLLFWS